MTRQEPDCCCFCGVPVPWNRQVRVDRRGAERLAHDTCALQVPIVKVRLQDRGKVLAIGFAQVGKGAGLGLTPRRPLKVGARC